MKKSGAKESHTSSNIDTALSIIQDKLAELQSQQNKLCEYVKKGIHSVEMFTKRNKSLETEMKQLLASEADLQEKRSDQEQQRKELAQIISYNDLYPQEKNKLWKIVTEKITLYCTPEGAVSLHIYPKLPM